MATLDGEPGADLTICLTGPESTGKTTLAQALADYFDAPLVPEVARDFLAGRESYDADDVLEITRAQIELETATRSAHRGLVVCDTDLLVLQIWWQEKFGPLPGMLHAALEARSPRSYLLLRPDLPWVEDPLRENPHDREQLFEHYLQLLEGSHFPFATIGGVGTTRLQVAVRAVQSFMTG